MNYSTPQYLKCFVCKANPSEFTFLNCNHIYCSECFLNKVQKSKKYSLVRCDCGGITYFNDDNQIIQSFQQSNISNQQFRQMNSTTEQRQSKVNFNLKMKSEAETLSNMEFSQIFRPNRKQLTRNFQSQISPKKQIKKQQFLLKSGQSIKPFSNIQRTAFDTSVQQEQHINNNNNNKYRSNGHEHINEFSTHNIYDNNSSSCNKSKVMAKNNKNKQDQIDQSSSSLYYVHQQFKSQIQFLKILFQKQMKEVEYKFQSILQEFRQKYKIMEKQLTTLYLENILTKQVTSMLNVSTLVKSKYYSCLGNKIKLLKDQLFVAHRATTKVSAQLEKSIFQQIRQRANKQPCNKHNNNNSNMNNNAPHQNKQAYKVCSKFYVVRQNQQQQQQQQYSPERAIQQNRSRIKNHNHNHNHNSYKFNKIQKQNQQMKANIDQFSKSSHRVQTENVNTCVKRPKSLKFNQRPTCVNYQSESQLEVCPNNRNRFQQRQGSDNHQRMRKHIIYYSPPLPYCYKHFQKKSRQTKNYINQIENLCKAKKLKSSKDLFKKFKKDNHSHNHNHNFSYRYQ